MNFHTFGEFYAFFNYILIITFSGLSITEIGERQSFRLYWCDEHTYYLLTGTYVIYFKKKINILVNFNTSNSFQIFQMGLSDLSFSGVFYGRNLMNCFTLSIEKLKRKSQISKKFSV
jgi:hypothetical protein